jgi:3-methyladenine DNA glycosylase/8-oxoguanine DNA glycosylase
VANFPRNGKISIDLQGTEGSMPTQTHTMETPPHYSLFATCHAHGWKYLAPFEWNDARDELRFATLAGRQAVDVVCAQDKRGIRVAITSSRRLSTAGLGRILTSIRRALDLDRETTPLAAAARVAGADFTRLLHNGAGRMLRGLSLWEDAAKTLFTTNCSWSLTVKMAEAACSEKFGSPAPSGRFPFPPPEMLAARSHPELKKLMPVGYRAEYLHALATRFATDASLLQMDNGGADPGGAYELARSLRGFGDYAASHLIIMAGHFHRIPVDTVVTNFLVEAYRTRNARSFSERHYQAWGKYRWWGLKLDQMRRYSNWIGD